MTACPKKEAAFFVFAAVLMYICAQIYESKLP
jgi:hypothetical protein